MAAIKFSSKKRGRPANEIPSVRISPRFPENVAEMLRRASDLRGVSVTSFVIESARTAAEQVIDKETRWRLDESETAQLARLLANPPKPNAAAVKAAKLTADVEIRS